MLRKTRIGLAAVVFLLITFFFLDFAELLPLRFHALAHIQFVPAAVSVSLGILAGLLLLTWLFGRVYCSVICPMGIFQDISARVSRWGRKKKKRYGYSKPKTALRWTVFALAVGTFAIGFPLLLNLIDPYSAFGRMVVNVFGPLYYAGNNLLEKIFTSFGNYTFYKMKVFIPDVITFVIGLVTFLGIGYLAWKHGRTYCNTICPVGTLLGWVNKYSLFKVRIDPEKCNGCGACSTKCKASCIDSKNETVDHSRCVVCFNCLGTCKKGALTYASGKIAEPREAMHTGEEIAANADVSAVAPVSDETYRESIPDESRRRFLSTTLGSLAVVPVLYAERSLGVLDGKKNVPYKRDHPICPPGAGNIDRFSRKCTACHLCIAKCPARILKPSFTEYGLSGLMQPTVYFEKGFCNYDCTICSNVCPNQALRPLSREEKHKTQIGRVVFVEENCVVPNEETNCGACSEHCPTQAVTMIPYKAGLTIPSTNPDICIGCGGCEFICPVRPFRAIYVNGNTEQIDRDDYEEAEVSDFEFDGFGF